MRIIAGKYKGRTLIAEKGDSIRPTTDRVKESIFNLIQSYIGESHVLDLFAGSGALGIEALSRGAENCVFCDKSSLSIEVLKKNLSKIDEKYEIFQRDYSFVISQMAKEGRKFNIIFLDPPYNTIEESRILAEISDSNILSENGIIVLEKRNEERSYCLPYNMCRLDIREYGHTIIDLIQLGNSVAITGTFDPYTVGHEYLVETASQNFKSVHIVLLKNPQKTPLLEIEKRKKIIKIAVRKFRANIVVEDYDGRAIDYCKNNDIRYILRGIRNQNDIKYEMEMAKWNEENGGIKTLFLIAKDSAISSSYVKKLAEEGMDISLFLGKEE
ncbi:MAG: Ribosomal RNA small subunit methyltransferase D [Firmicutes bacterium ADurb.Bin080]|jgi:16S rRNA (guanine966-N2)-methyltransferase|nr:16S rRNA (guanine(966)-N(2))-methyltransferase RsmD [Clostridiales bacterium]OQC12671.1 MAG: Ribosomal RNA small subunit methyltransferase D [Firmicutes bacterium ADurb.Bin080]